MKDEKKLRKTRTSYAVSTISLALVLFLLSAVGYLTWAALGVGKTLQESTVVTVELRDSLDDEQHAVLRRAFDAEQLVRETTFSSKEEKLHDEAFREAFGQDFEAILGENPLMDSYELSLTSASANRARIDSLITRVGRLEGVEGVFYPEQTTRKLHDTVAKFRLVLLLFGCALLVISLILLHNTIRLVIASKRNLIDTMKLVGASRGFILRPLLGKSVAQGAIAGVIAAALLLLALHGLGTFIPELTPPNSSTLATGSIPADYLRVGIVAGMLIVCGIVLSLLFTLFAAYKFIRKS